MISNTFAKKINPWHWGRILVQLCPVIRSWTQEDLCGSKGCGFTRGLPADDAVEVLRARMTDATQRLEMQVMTGYEAFSRARRRWPGATESMVTR